MSEAYCILLSLIFREKTKHFIGLRFVFCLCIDNGSRVEEVADFFSDLFSYGADYTVSKLSTVIWKDLLLFSFYL